VKAVFAVQNGINGWMVEKNGNIKRKKIVQSRYEHAIVTNLIIRSQKHKKNHWEIEQAIASRNVIIPRLNWRQKQQCYVECFAPRLTRSSQNVHIEVFRIQKRFVWYVVTNLWRKIRPPSSGQIFITKIFSMYTSDTSMSHLTT